MVYLLYPLPVVVRHEVVAVAMLQLVWVDRVVQLVVHLFLLVFVGHHLLVVLRGFDLLLAVSGCFSSSVLGLVLVVLFGVWVSVSLSVELSCLGCPRLQSQIVYRLLVGLVESLVVMSRCLDLSPGRIS